MQRYQPPSLAHRASPERTGEHLAATTPAPLQVAAGDSAARLRQAIQSLEEGLEGLIITGFPALILYLGVELDAPWCAAGILGIYLVHLWLDWLLGFFAVGLPLILAAVGGAFLPMFDSGKVTTTLTQLADIESGLKLYYSRHGRYPDTGEGLAVLVSERVLDKLPRDGFDKAFVYRNEGGKPTVTSLGKDGLPGGRGLYQDLSSQLLEEHQTQDTVLRQKLRVVAGALQDMKRETLRFPSEEEGLGLLLARGYLRAVPVDPWGHSLHYQLRDGYPVLRSLGADGAPGGAGPDADSEHVVPERGLAPPF